MWNSAVSHDAAAPSNRSNRARNSWWDTGARCSLCSDRVSDNSCRYCTRTPLRSRRSARDSLAARRAIESTSFHPHCEDEPRRCTSGTSSANRQRGGALRRWSRSPLLPRVSTKNTRCIKLYKSAYTEREAMPLTYMRSDSARDFASNSVICHWPVLMKRHDCVIGRTGRMMITQSPQTSLRHSLLPI